MFQEPQTATGDGEWSDALTRNWPKAYAKLNLIYGRLSTHENNPIQIGWLLVLEIVSSHIRLRFYSNNQTGGIKMPPINSQSTAFRLIIRLQGWLSQLAHTKALRKQFQQANILMQC